MIKEKEKKILELKETIKLLEEEKELLEKVIQEHFNIIEEGNKTTILTKENKKLFYKISDPKWETFEYKNWKRIEKLQKIVETKLKSNLQ